MGGKSLAPRLRNARSQVQILLVGESRGEWLAYGRVALSEEQQSRLGIIRIHGRASSKCRTAFQYQGLDKRPC